MKSETIAIVGIPFDEFSSFQRGAASAPTRILEALHSSSTNLCTESGIDLLATAAWKEIGNLTLPGGINAIARIEEELTRILYQSPRAIVLGGDHSVSYPVIKAFARKYPALNVLHFDAHPDLYDEFEGNKLSHACPFARIMEEQLVQRLVQVGIRSSNPHQREQAKRFGVQAIEMQNWRPGFTLEFDGPLYISLDLDVFDPAYAPGVSHPEPGGLSVRDVLTLIQHLPGPVVGADIVEYNPHNDSQGMTARVAAKCLKEILGIMLIEEGSHE